MVKMIKKKNPPINQGYCPRFNSYLKGILALYKRKFAQLTSWIQRSKNIIKRSKNVSCPTLDLFFSSLRVSNYAYIL